jgi:hypothetical protein
MAGSRLQQAENQAAIGRAAGCKRQGVGCNTQGTRQQLAGQQRAAGREAESSRGRQRNRLQQVGKQVATGRGEKQLAWEQAATGTVVGSNWQGSRQR